MPSPIKFSLRFIRKGATANTDDTVTITRNNNNNDTYTLTYTYGDTKIKVPRSLTLTDSGVFKWMRNTLRLLENDADPFDLIQLDSPFVPSVVINPTKLHDSYHNLLDVLEFHLDNWPEEEEGEEVDYSEMPPLIPLFPNSLTPIRHTHGRHHLFLDD